MIGRKRWLWMWLWLVLLFERKVSEGVVGVRLERLKEVGEREWVCVGRMSRS